MCKGINKCIEMCMKDIPRPANKTHGAVLIGKNGRILESGFNHYRTQCSSFKYGSPCSFHAEIDVLYRYINRMKYVQGANTP
jgi:tRNA(Arg) A34 adenosine deaminase TadA